MLETRRTRLAKWAVVAGLVVGGFTQYQVAAAEQQQAPCEYDACGVAAGNCFASDIKYNCAETAGGCTSTACPYEPDPRLP